MLKASVSNLELYRMWRGNDELDLDWLLTRILEPAQTPAMRAGEVFHKALEQAALGDLDVVEVDGFRFDFSPLDYALELPTLRELPISKQYGELTVRGRVDSLIGNRVTDYKTTEYFDADRLLEGYQWRFYLDMLEAESFRWEVFVLREAEDSLSFQVADVHRLEQRRYPGLHADCERLAARYTEFAKAHLIGAMLPTERKLRETLEGLGVTDAEVARV